MYVAKLKLAAVVVFALALVGAGGGLFGQSREPAAPNASAPAATTQTKQPVPPPAAGLLQDRPASQQAKRRDLEIRDTLSRTTKFDGIDDPKMTLQDTLDQMAARWNLQFVVNERAFKWINLKSSKSEKPSILNVEIANHEPIRPQAVPLATVLRLVLDRLPEDTPAVYLIRKDHIEITTESAARRELDIPNEKSFPKLVYEHFEDVPLLEALKTIAESADMNVVIEPTAAKTVKDVKVTAPLHNVPAEIAVDVLSRMGGLDMVTLGNVFYVLTKPEAAKMRLEMHPPTS